MTTNRLHARLDRIAPHDALMTHEEWIDLLEAERRRDPEDFAASAASVTADEIAAFFARNGKDRP